MPGSGRTATTRAGARSWNFDSHARCTGSTDCAGDRAHCASTKKVASRREASAAPPAPRCDQARPESRHVRPADRFPGRSPASAPPSGRQPADPCSICRIRTSASSIPGSEWRFQAHATPACKNQTRGAPRLPQYGGPGKVPGCRRRNCWSQHHDPVKSDSQASTLAGLACIVHERVVQHRKIRSERDRAAMTGANRGLYL